MVENSLLLSRANSAVISRDYALASRLYSTLLKENPDDKDLLARLGNVYIKSGEDEKALPVFQKIREKNPGDLAVLLTLGGIYRRIKKYEESIAVLNEALSAGAKREQVYYNLGFTYKFMERYEDAIDCFETVVTLNPVDVLAYNHLGTIYESKGDHEAAISAYLKGLKVDQNHPILHLNLANAYEHSDNIEGAIREYEAALRYKPGWGEAYADYTSLLLKIGRVGDAQVLGEQAISLNENDARLQSILGDIYMAESDYESAEKKYNDSIKILPDHAQTLKGLATSLERQGKNAKAIEAIQKARSISPNDEKLIKSSASINLSAQKLFEASKDIKELFDIDKNDVETLDLAGQYYICADDEKRAKKVFRKIEASNPEYKKHLFNASDRYKQKGNLAEAENCIMKYLSNKPNDSHGLLSLAMIEERLGKTESALENYKKAFENDNTNRLAKESSSRLSNIVIVKKAAVQEQVQEEAERAEQENLPEEFDMGQEPAAQQEDVAAQEELAEENILEDDDFDFESFGKTPLIDDEESEEIDFESIADDFKLLEQSQEKSMGEQLLEDSPEDDEGFDIPDFSEDEAAPKLEIPQEEKLEEKVPAPKLDASALAEKMAQMAESTRRVLEAAQNARQQEDARRLAEENARLRAQQEEIARRAAEETARKLAEEKAAAEEAARKLAEEKEAARKAAEESERKLAEEKAALEEAAKELKEEKEAFRKTIEDAMEDDENDAKKKALEEAMKKVHDFVPAVANILKDEDGERDFESQINLFKTLLALSESLPPKEKQEFMQSRVRVTLEYLISTLEGEPGLLKTSSALRKSGVLTDMASEEVSDADCPMDELLETVLGDMKSLSQDLEEEDLSIALGKLADEILEKE
ncbi:MAG: tetratricopeptide repeat protein [Treponema sp.]|nr:tetratricopeptide repeat protein [Treponema sp.]